MLFLMPFMDLCDICYVRCAFNYILCNSCLFNEVNQLSKRRVVRRISNKISRWMMYVYSENEHVKNPKHIPKKILFFLLKSRNVNEVPIELYINIFSVSYFNHQNLINFPINRFNRKLLKLMIITNFSITKQ